MSVHSCKELIDGLWSHEFPLCKLIVGDWRKFSPLRKVLHFVMQRFKRTDISITSRVSETFHEHLAARPDQISRGGILLPGSAADTENAVFFVLEGVDINSRHLLVPAQRLFR